MPTRRQRSNKRTDGRRGRCDDKLVARIRHGQVCRVLTRVFGYGRVGIAARGASEDESRSHKVPVDTRVPEIRLMIDRPFADVFVGFPAKR